MAQRVKHLPAMRETWVQSPAQEDPLEEEMATYSSISCLENSMDRGAWWATVHGISNSQTRLSTQYVYLLLDLHFFELVLAIWEDYTNLHFLIYLVVS